MKNYTFWQVLENWSIEIPKLQRNYVQGVRISTRDNKVSERLLGDRLIESVLNALKETSRTNLDFIYGVESDNIVYPLDGQQRLTLLWIIHWYVGACKDGGLSPIEKNILKKFSYSTRISSRYFIENLVDFAPNTALDNIRSQIQQCNWFYTKWLFDPTIDSILNVLEYRIEPKLKECDLTSLWERLTDPMICPITFTWKDIKDYSQTDDLYIKMNGRGRLLESLDNFRADIVKEFALDSNDDTILWIGNLMALFQGEWTELFWKKLSPDLMEKIYEGESNTISIEDNLYELLCRFFLCKQILECSESDRLSYDLIYDFSPGQKLSYTNLNNFLGEVENRTEKLRGILEQFELLMDKICKIESYGHNNSFNLNDFASPYWGEKGIHVIPDPTEKKVDHLERKGMIIFYAVVVYLMKVDGILQKEDFLWKAWMKLIWNIVENSTKKNIDGNTMISHIRLVDELGRNLLNDSRNFYVKLAGLKNIKSQSAKKQLIEEKEKARIRSNPHEFKECIDIVDALEKEYKGHIYFFYKDDDTIESDILPTTLKTRSDHWNSFKQKDALVQVEMIVKCCENESELNDRNFCSPSTYSSSQDKRTEFWINVIIDYISSNNSQKVVKRLLDGTPYTGEKTDVLHQLSDNKDSGKLIKFMMEYLKKVPSWKWKNHLCAMELRPGQGNHPRKGYIFFSEKGMIASALLKILHRTTEWKIEDTRDILGTLYCCYDLHKKIKIGSFTFDYENMIFRTDGYSKDGDIKEADVWQIPEEDSISDENMQTLIDKLSKAKDNSGAVQVEFQDNSRAKKAIVSYLITLLSKEEKQGCILESR